MDKVRENRARRVLHRRGLFLNKSRRKDPGAIGFGKYWIIDIEKNITVGGGKRGMSFDEVEEWIKEYDQTKKR